MVLVEFLDRDPMENMASCLSARRIEKVIFVGPWPLIERRRDIYRRFLADRKIPAAIEWREIDKNDLEDIIRCLSGITAREAACCFDLTGGDDLALVAVGAARERSRGNTDIQMHRINLQTSAIHDADGDGRTMPLFPPRLTVEEFVTLQGGVLYPPRELHPPFAEDVWQMWEVFRSNPAAWNAGVSYLNHMEGVTEPGSLRRDWSPARLRQTLGTDEACRILRGLVSRLIKAGVLNGAPGYADGIHFSYKGLWGRQVLEKTGNVLEMAVSALAQQAKAATGEPYYSDLVRGAVIDWNGAGDDGDVLNEVDLVLIRDYTPIFLSCKGGSVSVEELYKLDAVSRRFGGSYGKKVLVLTDYGKMSETARRRFQARAEELQIRLIDHVHQMSSAELARALSRLDQS